MSIETEHDRINDSYRDKSHYGQHNPEALMKSPVSAIPTGDVEIETIGVCIKALKRLDDWRVRVRVLKYLEQYSLDMERGQDG